MFSLNLSGTTMANFTQHGYEILGELGRNKNGGRVTHLAKSLTSDKQVVIKEFCFAQAGSDWNGYKAQEREIEALKKLDHPRIPKYIDAFETEDGFCLVQEYIDARSLTEIPEWKPRAVKNLAVSILEILEYLQSENAFHRDIKPENILIDENGNVYLIDFGCAKINSGESSTFVSGTLGFMSPEQRIGKELTNASDLYSLGVTLICLLTNIPSRNINDWIDDNFDFRFKKKPSNVNPDFIKWLENLVERKPIDRYPDARTALEELRPIPVDKLTTPPPPRRVQKRTPALKMPILFLLLLGAIGIGATIIPAELNRWKIADEQQKRIEEERQIEQQKRAETVQKLLTTKSCVSCDLRYVDLSNADLRGANLTSADLENANLTGANLVGANLIYSSLKGTNFSNADLSGVSIGRAAFDKNTNFMGANLLKIKLSGNLETVNFERANLQGANLQGANLQGANLQGANLQYANLSESTLQDANLEGANLEGANLSFTKLDGTNLKRSYVQKLQCYGSDYGTFIVPNGEEKTGAFCQFLQ